MNSQTQILIFSLLIFFSCKNDKNSTIQNTKIFEEEHPQFSSKFENKLKDI